MVEVTPHVNIQLNILCHSPRSVDLSLRNRCCLNGEIHKFWSVPEPVLPLESLIEFVYRKGDTKKERQGNEDMIKSQYSTAAEALRPQQIDSGHHSISYCRVSKYEY